MATFKVGDRVKRARHDALGIPLGATGIITRGNYQYGKSVGMAVSVRWDAPHHKRSGSVVTASTLEPLTPPDTWAADAVRKVTRPIHTEPVASKVTA